MCAGVHIYIYVCMYVCMYFDVVVLLSFDQFFVTPWTI